MSELKDYVLNKTTTINRNIVDSIDNEGSSSGLPTIQNGDNGKILMATVAREDVQFVPEQTITLESNGVAALSNVTLLPADFSSGDVVSITLSSDETTISSTAVYYLDFPGLGMPGFVDIIHEFGIVYSSEEPTGWYLFAHVADSSESVTISATISMPTGSNVASWEQLPGAFYIDEVAGTGDEAATLNKNWDEINTAYQAGQTVYIRQQTEQNGLFEAIIYPLTIISNASGYLIGCKGYTPQTATLYFSQTSTGILEKNKANI